MKREVILAIIIGFIIGLIITVGIYFAQSRYRASIVTPEEGDTTPSTPLPTPNQAIQILSPEDFALVTTPEITIIGFTNPNAYLTLVSQTYETVVETGETGNFEAEFTLEEGANLVTITMLDPNGSTITTDLTVTLLSPQPTATSSASPTPSTNQTQTQ